jgi:hypothetical protein
MNFTFTTEQINTLLKMLDNLPHGHVRPVVDYLLSECNKQMADANKPVEEPKAPEAVAG